MFFHYDLCPPWTPVADGGAWSAFERHRLAFLAQNPAKRMMPSLCQHMHTHENGVAGLKACLQCGTDLVELEAEKQRKKAELSPAQKGWLEYEMAHGMMPELSDTERR